MSPCHPFRPVPGQCGPNRRGPLPAPPFDPNDYWATKKFVSSLFGSIETRFDNLDELYKVDVVDPGAATEAGQAADAKKTREELNRILGVASNAQATAESKADKATTLEGYGITDAATKAEIAAKADLVGGKVPAAQLPSYVDDVLEYDTMSAFPATGESGKIYVAMDVNKTYRWSGTQYVEISPSPVLDDTVTEESPNGVKSSGIWSWVKSLLPHWLTSDYAEPATVASVEDKRGKDDLAVYKLVKSAFVLHKDGLTDVTLPFIVKDQGKPYPYNEYDWVYPIGETTAFHAIVFSDGKWKLNVDDGMEYGYSSASEDALRIEFDNGYVATRNSIMSTVPVDDKKLAAVATDNTLKPSDGDIVKYDATNNRIVKATAGADYIKEHQDISGKRDSGDFSVASSEKSGFVDLDLSVQKEIFPGVYMWKRGYRWRYEILIDGNLAAISNGFDSEDESKSVRQFSVYAYNYIYRELEGTTVSVVRYVDGPDTLVGAKYVGGLTSTNNPAFVSAVQNTPTSGMPEDMPTDWGIFGTVGAALAALAAGLKWCKNILGSLASGYSTFAAWIASKLDRASLVPEYSETSAYSVGVFVYHDGNIYQCKTAIAEGGEAWNAEHWELRKLDDFFTESNSLLTGRVNTLIDAKVGDVNAVLAAALDGTEVA